VHEMGICKGILDAAVEAAEEQNATRIKEIRISVGELTEIVDYALQFAFEALSPGTIAEGGTLVVERIPAASRCPQCGAEFEHGVFDLVCPECENPFTESIRGRELRIDSIDIDASEDGGESAPASEKTLDEAGE
jgi:hydrogenase nickel incorporation protein HypA/HybF